LPCDAESLQLTDASASQAIGGRAARAFGAPLQGVRELRRSRCGWPGPSAADSSPPGIVPSTRA